MKKGVKILLIIVAVFVAVGVVGFNYLKNNGLSGQYVNTDAKDLVTESSKKLIVVGKTIKALLEDHEKQRPEMLINWKEIDRFAETPIKDMGVDLYKKIYLFVSLMQMYV